MLHHHGGRQRGKSRGGGEEGQLPSARVGALGIAPFGLGAGGLGYEAEDEAEEAE